MRPEYFKICIYIYTYLNNKILSLLFRAGHEGGYIAEKIRYVNFFCNGCYLYNSHESSKKYFIVYLHLFKLCNKLIH